MKWEKASESEEAIVQLQDAVAALMTRITGLETLAEAQASTIEDLEERVNYFRTEAEERLERVRSRLNSGESRIRDLER